MLLASAVIVRLTVAVVSVYGHNFNLREKVFVAIAWLPKATVQASGRIVCHAHSVYRTVVFIAIIND